MKRQPEFKFTHLQFARLDWMRYFKSIGYSENKTAKELYQEIRDDFKKAKKRK